jgi:hypothetical protein
MDRQQQERADRLRAVLRKMERSIEDARSRRETEGRSDEHPGQPASPQSTQHGSPGLDTPIIGHGSTPSKPPPARTEDTMFDFHAPRLKARPKRRPAI